MTTASSEPPAPTVTAPPRRRNRMGLVALILGIVSLVFAFIPFLSYVAGFVGVVAIVLGIIAAVRAVPKGQAIAGIVLGALGLILGIVLSVVYSLLFVAAAVSHGLPSGLPTGLPSVSSLGSAPTSAAGGSVEYRVTGSGSAQTIAYATADTSGAGEDQVSKAELPWSKTIGVQGAGATHVFSLVAQASGSHKITCEIIENGKVLSKHSATGQYAVATCSATKS